MGDSWLPTRTDDARGTCAATREPPLSLEGKINSTALAVQITHLHPNLGRREEESVHHAEAFRAFTSHRQAHMPVLAPSRAPCRRVVQGRRAALSSQEAQWPRMGCKHVHKSPPHSQLTAVLGEPVRPVGLPRPVEAIHHLQQRTESEQEREADTVSYGSLASESVHAAHQGVVQVALVVKVEHAARVVAERLRAVTGAVADAGGRGLGPAMSGR